jgi:hypothetical protein
MQKSTNNHNHQDAADVANRHIEAMMAEVAAKGLCSDCALTQMLSVVSLNVFARGLNGQRHDVEAIADFGGYVARMIAIAVTELSKPDAEYVIKNFPSGTH